MADIDLLAELDEAEFCRCGKRHEECEEDGGCWWTATQDEIRRLRARVDDLAPFEPLTTGLHVAEDGSPVVDVHFPESFAQLMLASFRAYLDEHKAPNYVHMPMTDMKTGETYFCTIGRPGGKSPHEMREAAERTLAVIRHRAAAFLAEYDAFVALGLDDRNRVLEARGRWFGDDAIALLREVARG
jgi:hypothetical protein